MVRNKSTLDGVQKFQYVDFGTKIKTQKCIVYNINKVVI